MAPRLIAVVFLLFSVWQLGAAFQSDELTEDDEEWGIVGGGSAAAKARAAPVQSTIGGGAVTGGTERFRATGPATDKKVQFALEHSFGGAEFGPAGVFTVRVRDSVKGGQTLSKFRLARNAFSTNEKKAFEALIEADDFYSIRVPTDVLSPGKAFALSSVKARCLAASNFEERFDFQMDHGHVIGVTYGGSVSCSYPRAVQTPSQWTFDSLIIVKNAEQATRSLVMPEIVELLPDEDKLADDGTVIKKIPEKSFWAKYWMYIVPIVLIVINAITQVANMPEEGAPAGATQQRVAAGGGSARRR